MAEPDPGSDGSTGVEAADVPALATVVADLVGGFVLVVAVWDLLVGRITAGLLIAPLILPLLRRTRRWFTVPGTDADPRTVAVATVGAVVLLLVLHPAGGTEADPVDVENASLEGDEPSDGAGWTRYDVAGYGFSIEHPASWKVTESDVDVDDMRLTIADPESRTSVFVELASFESEAVEVDGVTRLVRSRNPDAGPDDTIRVGAVRTGSRRYEYALRKNGESLTIRDVVWVGPSRDVGRTVYRVGFAARSDEFTLRWADTFERMLSSIETA